MTTSVLAGPAFDREIRFGDIRYLFYFRSSGDWGEFAEKLQWVQAGHEHPRPVTGYIVVADAGVPTHLTHEFYAAVRGLGKPSLLLPIPADERMKTDASIRDLMSQSSQLLDKSTCIISFGGGLVSNVAGYWAGTQYRGLPFVEVSTTLLHFTDAALSLKQGINCEVSSHGGSLIAKNQLGVYKAPAFVWGDTSLFTGLPVLEKRAAWCEAIKNALAIWPEHLPAMMEHLRADGAYRDEDHAWLAQFCIEAKSRVMRHDPHEEGPALVLEYGHTWGHIFESLAKQYALAEPLPHGIAIAQGMLVAARVSVLLGLMTLQDERLHYDLLQRNGVRPHIPPAFAMEEMLELLRRDNKRGYISGVPGKHPMILLRALGDPLPMPTLVEEELLVRAVREVQAMAAEASAA